MNLRLASTALVVVLASACGNTVTVEQRGNGGDGGAPDATVVTSSHATTSNSVVSSSTGLGGSGGIGQPSDVYPAPHPAMPTVVTEGGTVLTAPIVVPITFTADSAGTRDYINTFVGQLLMAPYWNATVAEYGVGPAIMTPPVTLSESLASTIDDTDIQAWLQKKLNANDPSLPPANGQTVYTIFYPPGVTITSDFGQPGQTEVGCEQFGGYHSSTKLDAAHGNLEVAYAVIPRCDFLGTLSGPDVITGAASHEIVEAVTDPHPLSVPAFGITDADHLAFAIVLGGEVGDMCAQEPTAFTSFPQVTGVAQRIWSNAAAAASHDPCVPAQSGQPYFNAVPVLNDKIDLGQGFSMDAVTVPVGSSKTIDIKLFSDADTGGPFEVEAYDPLGDGLELSLDEDFGQNGQTLHLTVSPSQVGQYGFEVFLLSSTLNGVEHQYVGAVGN